MSSTTFLDRYIRGEYEEVWSELLTLGDSIQKEPLLSDAKAVVRETMNRVEYNINLLVKRLSSIGYVFGTFPDGRNMVYGYHGPHNPPKRDANRKIANLETLDNVFKIPLSLKMFWEIVGEVNFIGYHPLWPKFCDPLVVYSYEAIEYEYDLWKDEGDNGDVEVGSFCASIAPDYYHKSNVSGGESYKIRLPNGSIDAILENEKHTTTFVNYLRIAFRQGGFAGIEMDFRPSPLEIIIDGLKPI